MHIVIVSPAGAVKNKVIDNGAETLRSWGHKVTIAEHAKGNYGRYSASPEDRAADIVGALKDPKVDAIFAARGGYGCMQILDKIPVELIAKARKPIIGYSDVTALHALWQKAGVQSLHAPMMKHLGEEPGHRTSKTLRELLSYYEQHRKDEAVVTGNASPWPTKHNQLFLKLSKVKPGLNPDDSDVMSSLEGKQWIGGNLSVMGGLHGTPFDYDYKGKVLFIEDIAESPYKIDRLMQQLRLMGVFGKPNADDNSIAALVCGHFTNCDEDPLMPLKLWDNIRIMAEEHNIPCYMGAPIGHELENFPLIVG